MLRSFAKSLLVLPFALVACSAPTEQEDTAAEETEAAISSSAQTITRAYEGSFEVKGKTFDLLVEVALPSVSRSYFQMDSTRWHSDSLGFCRAFVESTKGSFRIRVTDASGKVIVDDTKQAWANSSLQLDRGECRDGFLSNPRVLPTLPATVDRDGLTIELAGERVQLPIGYGSHGTPSLEGTANYRAISRLDFQRWDDNGYSKSEAKVERGALTFDFPREVVFKVGVGRISTGLGAEQVDVTLRAR